MQDWVVVFEDLSLISLAGSHSLPPGTGRYRQDSDVIGGGGREGEGLASRGGEGGGGVGMWPERRKDILEKCPWQNF
jgi:hypothetical protein